MSQTLTKKQVAEDSFTKWCQTASSKEKARRLFDETYEVVHQIALKTDKLSEIKKLQCESYGCSGNRTTKEDIERAASLLETVQEWFEQKGVIAALLRWAGMRAGPIAALLVSAPNRDSSGFPAGSIPIKTSPGLSKQAAKESYEAQLKILNEDSQKKQSMEKNKKEIEYDLEKLLNKLQALNMEINIICGRRLPPTSSGPQLRSAP